MSLHDTVIDSLLEISTTAKIAHVGKEITIHGVLTVDSDLPIIIAGKVVGEVVSNGTVILSDTAEVHGPIRAANLQVAGLIVSGKGKVHVNGLLILNSTAKVSVDAQYAKMKVDYGAQMSGSFQPHDQAGDTPAVKAKPLEPVQQASLASDNEHQSSSEDLVHTSDAVGDENEPANEHRYPHSGT